MARFSDMATVPDCEPWPMNQQFDNIFFIYYLDCMRKHPPKGVFADFERPTVVYATICTKSRRPWLANSRIHAALLRAWQKCTLWRVGPCVIMPIICIFSLRRMNLTRISIAGSPVGKDMSVTSCVRLTKDGRADRFTTGFAAAKALRQSEST